MVRTLVTPEQQNISIHVPQNYVGKQIEVLMYAVDELVDEEKKVIVNNAGKYKGILTKEEAVKFNDYIKQARNEWDSNI